MIDPQIYCMHWAKDKSADRLANSLKPPRGSPFARAVGREQRAAWGNRFLKDFYDLDYEHPDSFSPLKGKQGEQEQRKGEPHGKKVAAAVNVSCHNPEKISMGHQDEGVMGLCPYEYKETLSGRINNRSGHHLSFRKNRVSRTINENPVYYDRHQSIDLTRSEVLQRRRAEDEQHPFASYTERKTFEPRDELDKFFDTEGGLKMALPCRSPSSIRRFESMAERSDPRKRESAVLSYQLGGSQKMRPRAVSYSIGSQERETGFSPQVISERRGCYR